jgi:hypothetical protein
MTHNERIEEFLRGHPGWRRTGLRREIAAFVEEPLRPLGFIPDAFQVQPGRVDLLEVEGHSYIAKRKLQRLLDFWSELDCRGWFLTMTVIDAFTGAVSHLDDRDFERLWSDSFYAVA